VFSNVLFSKIFLEDKCGLKLEERFDPKNVDYIMFSMRNLSF